MHTFEPKILVVDDSREDRILMAQALADAGLERDIDEAADGEEAELYLLQKLSEGALPHLVILDLMLPKRSGLEVMERWCANGLAKLTRVIVLSSVLRESEIAKLQALGALQVFEKPIDLEEFLALAQHLRKLACMAEPCTRTNGQATSALSCGRLNQNADPSPNLESAQSFPPQA
jgi:DNA-binding response OmpR family regulator